MLCRCQAIIGVVSAPVDVTGIYLNALPGLIVLATQVVTVDCWRRLLDCTYIIEAVPRCSCKFWVFKLYDTSASCVVALKGLPAILD